MHIWHEKRNIYIISFGYDWTINEIKNAYIKMGCEAKWKYC